MRVLCTDCEFGSSTAEKSTEIWLYVSYVTKARLLNVNSLSYLTANIVPVTPVQTQLRFRYKVYKFSIYTSLLRLPRRQTETGLCCSCIHYHLDLLRLNCKEKMRIKSSKLSSNCGRKILSLKCLNLLNKHNFVATCNVKVNLYNMCCIKTRENPFALKNCGTICDLCDCSANGPRWETSGGPNMWLETI